MHIRCLVPMEQPFSCSILEQVNWRELFQYILFTRIIARLLPKILLIQNFFQLSSVQFLLHYYYSQGTLFTMCTKSNDSDHPGHQNQNQHRSARCECECWATNFGNHYHGLNTVHCTQGQNRRHFASPQSYNL